MSLYVVRGVTSGDLITVVDPKEKNDVAPTKKQIGISQIKCPKVGRWTPNEGAHPDEEFGWEAREFARKAIIGKTIKFVKEATIDVLGRDIGEVLYQEDGKTKNLGVGLVEQGLALTNIRGKPNDYTKALAEAELVAVTEARGQHGNDGKDHSRLEAKWEVTDSELQGLGKLRGQKLQAIVENVFAGHSMRVCLLPLNIYVPIQLTGIVCDKKSNDSHADPNKMGPSAADKALFDECHVQAKGLTDRLLTHKEVTVIVEGTMFDSLQCTVMSGEKVFQEALLDKGLAKIFEMNIAMATHRDRLRAAEARAKEAKAGRWKNYIAPQLVKGSANQQGESAKAAPIADFKGTVLQCVSADMFVILNETTGEEMRLGLAGVRGGGSTNHFAPRARQAAGDEGQQNNVQQNSTFSKMVRDEKSGSILFTNWYLEGRDFVRERLLGKQVSVKCDFMANMPVQPSRDSKEKDLIPKTELRPAVSIYYDGDKNIGEEVIKAGFAVPISSKDGSAKDQDKYSDAFEDAKTAKRGIHSGKGGEHKVQDMARPDEKRGKAMLGHLQRSGAGNAGVPKLKATVEMVLSAARVRLLVERENAIISVNLAGIAVPQTPLPNTTDEADPLAEEAALFTKRRLLQRDVEVQIEFFGHGTFVGNVYVNGKSFAIDLLDAGFATMIGQNTSSMSCKNDAEAAEEAAKKAGKGIHSAGYPKRVAKAMERDQVRMQGRVTFMIGDQKQVPATITEVLDATHFYFQTEENKAKMKEVDMKIGAQNPAELPAPKEAADVPPGSMVCARYSQDKKWYRARAGKAHPGNKIDVFFLDFGNRETLPISEVRKHGFVASMLTVIPPQANEAHLAFMHQLERGEPGQEEGTDLFCGFVEGRAITVAHEYTDGKQKFYTVRFGKKAVQEELIKTGLGLVAMNVQENASVSKPVKYLSGLEAEAKRSKTGMWGVIHGDPRSYDDDY